MPSKATQLAAALVAFVLFPLSAALAQDASSDPARDGPRVDSFTLDNGMQVVVIPDHRAPVVTHMVWYKVGAADEAWGKSGIAHFLEHLMFKGTTNTPEREFSTRVAEIGGQENAFTTADYTAYYQKVSPEALPMVMGYEADRMENLTLTDANVLPERDVILEERRQRVGNNPGAVLAEAMGATLYENHPYRIPIIGWEHEMASLTRQDALDFYGKYYTPNNAILVVAGDVEPQAVLEMARATYGKVKRRAEPGTRVRPSEPEPQAARRVTYSDVRVANAAWQRDYLTPSYRTAAPREAEALDLLASILGEASVSRLRRDLMLDNQLVAGVSSYYQGGHRDYGEFNIRASLLPGVQPEAVEKRVDAIIERLLKDGVSEAELADAKESLVRTAIFERDSQTTMARVYGSTLASGRTIADIEEWPDRVRSVTVDDVNAAARKWLIARRSVTGTLLPKEGS